MTGAHFSIGVNPIAGIVYFLNRRSAQEAAKLYWGRAASREELPALRSSSDIAWGFGSRERWGGLEGIKGFMSLMVVNVDTRQIVDEVLRARYGEFNEGVLPWPGTTFDVDDVEGQALLGMSGPSEKRVGWADDEMQALRMDLRLASFWHSISRNWAATRSLIRSLYSGLKSTGPYQICCFG